MANEDDEKQHPLLTLMEEVLLLGLKDKQVRSDAKITQTESDTPSALRVTSASGTTTSLTPFADAFSWNWLCEVG